ncbi:MAG TPA: cation diffusion facilitator family transporter [Pirellulales bacterium]|nr:cation diffusion facilitator family transporter [Pirellulales bacterium]
MIEPPPPKIPPPAERLSSAAAGGIRIILWGVLLNALMAAVKICAGVLGQAYALVADGVESLADVVSSLVVSGGLRIAAIPPDENHPFGHGKAESLSAMVAAVALLATGVGIAIQSIRALLNPPSTPPAVYTLVVLVGVIGVKELMFRMIDRMGRQIGSQALLSEAWHHRSDAITSLAAFIGITVAIVGGPRYIRADAWAALLACMIIVGNGVRLFRRALDDVMDSAPAAEVDDQIRRIAAAVPEVAAIEKCRVRRSGLSLLVDIHVEVDGNLTVRRGHEIAHDVKQALLDSQLSILDATVHIEPTD